jgi:hypothetical protein
MRLFQNPVGFETTAWKSGQMPAFPCKSKVAVPKTEVLEQPQIISPNPGKTALTWYGNILEFNTFFEGTQGIFPVKSVFYTARYIAPMNTRGTPAARMYGRDGAAENQKMPV